MLFYCFGSNSTCYGVDIYENSYNQFVANVDVLIEKGYLPSAFKNNFGNLTRVDSTWYNFSDTSNLQANGYALFIRDNGQICVAFAGNSSGIYTFTNSSGNYNYNNYTTNYGGICFYFFSNTGSYSSNSNMGTGMQTWTYKYVFTTCTINTRNLQMTKNSEDPEVVSIPPFSVVSDFEDVSVDNVQNKAFRLDFNQPFSNIGHLESIRDDSHFVNIIFSQVGGGLLLRDTLNMYNMFNSSEDFYIDENYDIYIRNRLLMYNTKYLLTADTFTDSTFTTQTGNYDLNYYTITPNAVISGGIITNFGSGDYSIQNSINDTIDFYTDDTLVNSEIDSFFSGDTNSIVSNLNFPNLENNYFVVIYNVVAGISDTLQMSGDPYFDVSLHGETPKRIYASDFTTPPSVLKTFISMSLIFGTLYILYLQLSGFLMLINTGHVKDAINQIDDVSGATLYKM